jgi:hypothetical protein
VYITRKSYNIFYNYFHIVNRYSGFVGHTLYNDTSFSQQLQTRYCAWVNILQENYQDSIDQDALAVGKNKK